MNARDRSIAVRLRLLACLAAASSMEGCLLAAKRDSIPPMLERLPDLSQGQPRPLWRARLKAQETDFIRFVSNDRVLIGTIETAELGWGLAPQQIMLLDAANGEAVWATPRSSLGHPQMLLVTDPVILLQGRDKYAAFDPQNGARIWERVGGEGSLLLPVDERIVLLSRSKASVSLTAVSMRDGSEAWSASIENYPEVNGRLELKAVGDTLLVVGPESAALSARTGRMLWRRPFPGTFGLAAAAIPLGDDLYLTDGSVVARSDPATGNALWQQGFPAGSVRNISESDRSVLVLLEAPGGAGSQDAIQALDRKTGQRQWKYDLPEKAQSPMTIEGRRIYVTTASTLVALDASRGYPVFKSAIPASLQARRLLPDILRILEDRIIVSREIGVMAVQRQDGKLLYAAPVLDGAPFTYDYTAHKMSRALESMTPPKARPQLQVQVAATYSDFLYRSAIASQQFVYASTAATLRTGTSLEKQIARSERITAVDRSIAALSARQNEERMQATLALVASIANAAQETAGAIIQAVRASRMSVMQAELAQAYQTHANSLQNGFYVRPRYEQGRAWSLALVDLTTGKRADILLSPNNDPLSCAAANLPAFAIDAADSRMLSKGIGLDPDLETYSKLAPGGSVRVSYWNVPYPSVLAFDLSSLRFGRDPVSRVSPRRPPIPGKGQLNDRLIKAAFQGDVETVKAALDAGADVDAVDEYGQTALMLAAESLRVHGKEDVIEELLARGADVSMKDPGGWTAIEHFSILSYDAMTSGVSDGLGLLLEAQEKARRGGPRN